jgi:hypothetical protein
MSRQQLLDIAARFTEWMTSQDSDPATLSAFVSKDVVVHVSTPGVTDDFAGLLARHDSTMTATKDLKVDVKTQSVDETNGTVTQFFEVSGTQTGYITTSPLPASLIVWRGANRAGSGMGFLRRGSRLKCLV